jgi:hypothetical protein
MNPISAEDNYKGIGKKIRDFFSDTKVFNRSENNCETFLDQSLGCLEEYTWRFSGKIRKTYTADTRNYSNMLVRAYFPFDSICLVMSLNRARGIPIIKNILAGEMLESAIHMSYYKGGDCCMGSYIVLCSVALESIMLTNDESLKDKITKDTWI